MAGGATVANDSTGVVVVLRARFRLRTTTTLVERLRAPKTAVKPTTTLAQTGDELEADQPGPHAQATGAAAPGRERRSAQPETDDAGCLFHDGVESQPVRTDLGREDG